MATVVVVLFFAGSAAAWSVLFVYARRAHVSRRMLSRVLEPIPATAYVPRSPAPVELEPISEAPSAASPWLM